MNEYRWGVCMGSQQPGDAERLRGEEEREEMELEE